MPRDRLTEFLQVGTFHLFDVSASLPLVLVPLFGFHKVTAPSIHFDIMKIKEGNVEIPRKVIKGADAGAVTMERGISIIDSDFSDWARKAMYGQISPKDLLLVQFAQVGFAGGNEAKVGSGFFSFEFVKRLPGRAWLLKSCVPSEWKAASDFDAMTQEISVTSLTVEMEEVHEFNLGI